MNSKTINAIESSRRNLFGQRKIDNVLNDTIKTDSANEINYKKTFALPELTRKKTSQVFVPLKANSHQKTNDNISSNFDLLTNLQSLKKKYNLDSSKSIQHNLDNNE